MNEKFYGKLIELVRNYDNRQWDIGDEIARICPSSSSGNQDGSHKVLQEISVVLYEEGFEYSVDALRKLRLISEVFDSENRFPLAWTVHLIAASPTMLKAIIERAGKRKLTTALARILKEEILTEYTDISNDLIRWSEKASNFLADYVNNDEEIEFELGQVEKDKLVHNIIKLQNQCQELLKKLNHTSTHLRIVGE